MIYTSYFSSKKYNKENGISIARYNKFWDGESYPLLYPSASLLTWWKGIPKEAAKEDWFTDQYEQAYFKETLELLDPHKVAAELEGKVLLCYEKSEDFCHRHLVAEWLRSYGYEVKEL
jgi:uncharacterized protein (DUF488 family)